MRVRVRVRDVNPNPNPNPNQVSSWGYVEGKSDYKSARSLLHDLLDIVSKNGNLLLNVGPRGDGTIPPDAAALLEELGGWLQLHGEAVYGTRPWRCYGEGSQKVVQGQMTERRNGGFGERDIRFTVSKEGRTLYAALLGWPRTALATIAALAPHEEVRTVAPTPKPLTPTLTPQHSNPNLDPDALVP